jgi:hypothetical protein
MLPRKERLGGLGVNATIILKLIFNKHDESM